MKKVMHKDFEHKNPICFCVECDEEIGSLPKSVGGFYCVNVDCLRFGLFSFVSNHRNEKVVYPDGTKIIGRLICHKEPSHDH